MKIQVPSDSDPEVLPILNFETSSDEEYQDTYSSPISYNHISYMETREINMDDTEHQGSQGSQMIRDATFGKWDGEPLTWPTHYQLLRVQCQVYLPFLVTEIAICMKIYESIPEPQRQRIRNYWIQCGRSQCYKWEEFLSECNKVYFDKVAAEKAEAVLYSMKQGEAQIFRQFLQEWELQLEFAGGYDWPDTFKIKQLRRSISEKLLDKTDVLRLPKDNYTAWVETIAEVASNMEMRDNFARRGEPQVTQFTTRQTVHQTNPSSTLQTSTQTGVDYEGDTIMGGMKIDLKQLTEVIAVLNAHNNNRGSGNNSKKKPAPWRTEEEMISLRERKLCLRCEKPGHISRYCKKLGPPIPPKNVNNLQDSLISPEEYLKYGSGKE